MAKQNYMFPNDRVNTVDLQYVDMLEFLNVAILNVQKRQMACPK